MSKDLRSEPIENEPLQDTPFSGRRGGHTPEGEIVHPPSDPPPRRPEAARRPDGSGFIRRHEGSSPTDDNAAAQGLSASKDAKAVEKIFKDNQDLFNWAEAAIGKLEEVAVQSQQLTDLVDKVAQLTDRSQEQQETIDVLRESIAQIQGEAQDLRNQIARNEPIEQSRLGELEGAVVRVTVATLVCGVLTGVMAPAMILLTAKSIVGTKIIEGVAGGLIAAVSIELANRAADPTSHRHRD